jgi:hypothetical protein
MDDFFCQIHCMIVTIRDAKQSKRLGAVSHPFGGKFTHSLHAYEVLPTTQCTMLFINHASVFLSSRSSWIADTGF